MPEQRDSQQPEPQVPSSAAQPEPQPSANPRRGRGRIWIIAGLTLLFATPVAFAIAVHRHGQFHIFHDLAIPLMVLGAICVGIGCIWHRISGEHVFWTIIALILLCGLIALSAPC